MSKNKEELKDLIRYYLDHPDERMSIAQRVRIRVLKDHTYKRRMNEVIAIIGKVLGY